MCAATTPAQRLYKKLSYQLNWWCDRTIHLLHFDNVVKCALINKCIKHIIFCIIVSLSHYHKFSNSFSYQIIDHTMGLSYMFFVEDICIFFFKQPSFQSHYCHKFQQHYCLLPKQIIIQLLASKIVVKKSSSDSIVINMHMNQCSIQCINIKKKL